MSLIRVAIDNVEFTPGMFAVTVGREINICSS